MTAIVALDSHDDIIYNTNGCHDNIDHIIGSW